MTDFLYQTLDKKDSVKKGDMNVEVLLFWSYKHFYVFCFSNNLSFWLFTWNIKDERIDYAKKVAELQKHLINEQSVREALEKAMSRTLSVMSPVHNYLTPQVYRKGLQLFFISPSSCKVFLVLPYDPRQTPEERLKGVDWPYYSWNCTENWENWWISPNTCSNTTYNFSSTVYWEHLWMYAKAKLWIRHRLKII